MSRGIWDPSPEGGVWGWGLVGRSQSSSLPGSLARWAQHQRLRAGWCVPTRASSSRQHSRAVEPPAAPPATDPTLPPVRGASPSVTDRPSPTASKQDRARGPCADPHTGGPPSGSGTPHSMQNFPGGPWRRDPSTPPGGDQPELPPPHGASGMTSEVGSGNQPARPPPTLDLTYTLVLTSFLFARRQIPQGLGYMGESLRRAFGEVIPGGSTPFIQAIGVSKAFPIPLKPPRVPVQRDPRKSFNFAGTGRIC